MTWLKNGDKVVGFQLTRINDDGDEEERHYHQRCYRAIEPRSDEFQTLITGEDLKVDLAEKLMCDLCGKQIQAEQEQK